MIINCPKCGYNGCGLTPYRKKLLEVANGEYTRTEIAALVDKPIDSVQQTLYSLKNQGFAVTWKEEPDTSKRERDKDIFGLFLTGLWPVVNLARLYGISSAAVGQVITRQARKARMSTDALDELRKSVRKRPTPTLRARVKNRGD